MKRFAGIKQVVNELGSQQLPISHLLLLTPASSSEARAMEMPLMETGKYIAMCVGCSEGKADLFLL